MVLPIQNTQQAQDFYEALIAKEVHGSICINNGFRSRPNDEFICPTDFIFNENENCLSITFSTYPTPTTYEFYDITSISISGYSLCLQAKKMQIVETAEVYHNVKFELC